MYSAIGTELTGKSPRPMRSRSPSASPPCYIHRHTRKTSSFSHCSVRSVVIASHGPNCISTARGLYCPLQPVLCPDCLHGQPLRMHIAGNPLFPLRQKLPGCPRCSFNSLSHRPSSGSEDASRVRVLIRRDSLPVIHEKPPIHSPGGPV